MEFNKRRKGTLSLIALFMSVSMLFLSFNKVSASSVTVLPGNGGTLPLVNRLLIHQNDNSLKNIETNTADRSEVTSVSNNRQRVMIKKVTGKDQITINYGKVGTYAGQAVTAKMIISDLKLHDKSHQPLFGLTHDDVSLDFGPGFSSGINSINNIARFNVSFEFFDTSGNQLDINHSFLTISSLDGPQPGKSSGFEYTAFLNPGKIYKVQNSVVNQTTDPLNSSQLVMAGYKPNTENFPYFSASGATFEVYGKSLDFIYGTTRASLTNNEWVTPMFALSTVTLGKPDINEPKLTAKSNEVTAGDNVTYDLKQSVNILNEDLLNKYNNWTETLQLSKGSEYQSGKVTDDNNNVLADTDYQVAYDKTKNTVTYTLSKSGIDKMKFSGESYHFKIELKTSKTTVDQTKLNVIGTTTIDGQSKKVTNNKVVVNNKRTIIVHHYMTDSKDKVIDDQKVELGYGKNYQLMPLSYKPVGYTYNKKLDVNTKGVMTDDVKEATFYYDADPFYIHINYLLENGQSLDKLNILGLYGDTYTTQASDYDDLYTLVTEKLPNNITGLVTEKPIIVNYYYRPTTGKWVDVGNDSSVLTRTDYKGNVRSVSQVYPNETGYSVKFDLNNKQVAITTGNSKISKTDTDKVIKYNTTYSVQPTKGEKIGFKIDKSGSVAVSRTNGYELIKTNFSKDGKIETTDTKINGDNTISSQKNVVDGKKSVVTKEQYTQDLGDGYKITAQKNIDQNAQRKELPSSDFIDLPQEKEPVIEAPETPDSFNEGVPMTEPKTDSNENTSPNNDPDNYQTPSEASPSTNVQLTKNGQPVVKKTLKSGQEETPLYTTPNVQIAAGADDKGFYADRFNKDNDPKAYTMGTGYHWDAPKDPRERKDGKPVSSLPQTGEKILIGATILGIIIIMIALILSQRSRRGVR